MLEQLSYLATSRRESLRETIGGMMMYRRLVSVIRDKCCERDTVAAINRINLDHGYALA